MDILQNKIEVNLIHQKNHKNIKEKTLFYKEYPKTLQKLKNLMCIHLQIDNFEIEGYNIYHVWNKGEFVDITDEDDLLEYFEEKGNPMHLELVVRFSSHLIPKSLIKFLPRALANFPLKTQFLDRKEP